MKREKAVLILVLLLAILTVGAWEVSTMRTDTEHTSAASQTPRTSQTPSPSIAIDLPLVLRTTVQGKSYTYSGSIWVPNACDAVSSGISLKGTDPSHVTIALSAQSVECPTLVKTQADFSVSLTSTGTKAPVVDAVTFDGMEIPYTLSDGK